MIYSLHRRTALIIVGRKGAGRPTAEGRTLTWGTPASCAQPSRTTFAGIFCQGAKNMRVRRAFGMVGFGPGVELVKHAYTTYPLVLFGDHYALWRWAITDYQVLTLILGSNQLTNRAVFPREAAIAIATKY